jgi:hypothetical protein
LGDVVSWFTRALRLQECARCSQRKMALNRFTLWRSRASGRRN